MAVASGYMYLRVPESPPKNFDWNELEKFGGTINTRRVNQCKRIAVDAVAPEKLYHQFVIESTPIIVTGAADTLLRKASGWKPSKLRKIWGSQVVDVQSSPDRWFTRPDPDGRVLRHATIETMTFGQFIDHAVAGCCWAVAQFRMEGLETLMKQPQFAKFMKKKATYMWVAQDQKVSPLHYDEYNGIIVQAVGTKTVKLVDPVHLGSLYPSRMPIDLMARHNNGTWSKRRCPCPNFNKKETWNFSPVNLTKIDKRLYPDFNQSNVIECVLEPGEMLLVPAHWWHEVHNHAPDGELNIAFNTWSFGPIQMERFYNFLRSKVWRGAL